MAGWGTDGGLGSMWHVALCVHVGELVDGCSCASSNPSALQH